MGKQILSLKTSLVLAAAVACAAARGAVLDGIAAKVNDDVITVGDVMTELQRNPAARERFTAGNKDAADLYREALETVIDRKLILRAAAAKKMEMQEWLVDNRVREIVNDGFGGDMNRLTAALTESKTSLTDWRNNIRDDMIVQAMRYQMIEKYVHATPSAMRKEYAEHRERYNTKASTTVSVILLRPPRAGDTGTPSVSTRGEEILARLDKGEDFASLARLHSADSHAADGGVWKDVNPAEAFRPEIAEVIANLKVGEFSPLVDIGGWGFIVRKDAETFAKRRTFAEAYDDIARNVKRAAAKEQYDAWVKRLRADAFVKTYPMPE